ncbi:hypothetical protein ACLBX9_30865 [Methylobacterium sp. A49B]
MSSIERDETGDIALRLIARAYHALAVFYEIKSPTDYDYFNRRIMPYLMETVRADGILDGDHAVRTARAVERVRVILTEVEGEIASIRQQALSQN